MRFHLAIPAIFAVASLCFGNGCSGGGGESDVSGPADSEWFDVVSDEGTEDAGIEDAGLDARPDQGGQDVGEADNGQGESYPNACRGLTSCRGLRAPEPARSVAATTLAGWSGARTRCTALLQPESKDSQSCGWRVVKSSPDTIAAAAVPSGRYLPLECGDTCIPDCKGRDCGSDGCGGYCGTCGEGFCANPVGACSRAPNNGRLPRLPGAERRTCPGYISTYGCCDAQGRVVWCDRGRIYCNDCSCNPAPQNCAVGLRWSLRDMTAVIGEDRRSGDTRMRRRQPGVMEPVWP